MPTQHVVREGECISSIALAYGFAPETIWDHPANASLRGQRDDPNVLAPGDMLNIPDKRERAETRNTGALHRFQKKSVPAYFRLQLFDDNEEPRANQPYKLVVDGVALRPGNTDATGVLQVAVSPAARRAELTIGGGEEEVFYELHLGHLQPVSEIDGVQARLNNLGFACRESGELDEETRTALRCFQARFELEITGEPDDATRAKLLELHDHVGDLPEDQTPAEAEEETAGTEGEDGDQA